MSASDDYDYDSDDYDYDSDDYYHEHERYYDADPESVKAWSNAYAHLLPYSSTSRTKNTSDVNPAVNQQQKQKHAVNEDSQREEPKEDPNADRDPTQLLTPPLISTANENKDKTTGTHLAYRRSDRI